MHRDGGPQTGAREGRRRALRTLGVAGCAVLAGAASGTGCSRGTAGEDLPRIRVSLSDLPPAGRTVVSLGGRPVELHRTAAGVTARSLLCTHFGCRVTWDERESAYVCPCHHGRFDAAGRPVAGPPRLPLAELPVHVEGETVWLEAAGPSST